MQVDVILSEKTANKVIDLFYSPSTLIFIGLFLIALVYTLYPFHKKSIIPGVFIGVGVVGITWVVYKIVFARR